MKRIVRPIILVIILSLLTLPGAPASATGRQSTVARFDGNPSVGGTLSVALLGSPADSITTFKWKSGKTVLGTDSSLLITPNLKVGQQVQVSVTNTAPGFYDWTYVSPVIKLGQITLISKGEHSGSALVGSENFSYYPEIFPPIRNQINVLQYNPTHSWNINGVEVAPNSLRFTPDSSAIGKVMSSTSTYTYNNLPPLRIVETFGKVLGLNSNVDEGTLNSKYLVGQTAALTSQPTWEEAPDRVKFQWTKDGKAIAKATGQAYKLTSADWHHNLALKITATKAHYQTVVVTLQRGTVYKETTKVGTLINGSTAMVGCEGYDINNFLCMPAQSNTKWMGVFNSVETENDMLYASLSGRSPAPTGVAPTRWKATVVGISSIDLYPEEASAPGAENSVDGNLVAKFSASTGNKNTTWTTPWFTARPSLDGNLNLGLWALDSGVFIVKSVQITAVYEN